MTATKAAGAAPCFLIEEYFAGKTRAWGIFQDRFGKLRRQFVVDIEGLWDGETLTLAEDFLYDDGQRERRTWHIRKTGAQRYDGTADGVVGSALGWRRGSMLNWRYRFALKVGANTWTVHFDDWMFLQDDGVMINRAKVTKFGIRLGEVTIAFTKLPAVGGPATLIPVPREGAAP
jgi:hypothetical protein